MGGMLSCSHAEADAKAAGGVRLPSGEGFEVLRIPSPAANGGPATGLLARLAWRPGRDGDGPFGCAVVYLHGFPDQSVDHREEDPAFGEFSSRFPTRLAPALLDEVPSALFVAFNFAGTPGSDRDLPFFNKTVGREVSDARAVVRFLRESGRLSAGAPVHVIGLSTGAIISALLRGAEPRMTATVVAGLLDIQAGLHYDFDEKQLRAFDEEGSCLKEFWLHEGSPSNPPIAASPPRPPAGPGMKRKVYLRLSAEYRRDYLTLDVATAVGRPRNDCPLLVIHGSADKSVPLSAGEAVFGAAAEPKRFVLIDKGNHLLSNTKHFNRMAREFLDMVKEHS